MPVDEASLPSSDPAVSASPTIEGATRDVLDATSPMPDDVVEDSIFASMRSNWFSAESDAQLPWSTNEADTGWKAADRVANQAPQQVSETGLPIRRPGSRVVPGGVSAPAPTLVRDPEALRARLAAHAAGVDRGRQAANGALAVDPRTDEHASSEPSEQEVDNA